MLPRSNTKILSQNRQDASRCEIYTVDNECDFSDYKLIIFPDIVIFDEALAAKVNAYLANDGKTLLSGESGLTSPCGAAANMTFFTDFGVTYQRRSEIDHTIISRSSAICWMLYSAKIKP